MISAAEETHPDREKHRAGPGRADAKGVAIEHPFDFGVAGNPALVLRFLGKVDEVGAAILPAFGAVAAAHRTVDLERRIHIVRMIGIDREPHHAACKRHLDAVGYARVLHSAPAVAAVVAAKDRDRRRTRIEDSRVGGVNGYRPDAETIVRKAEPFPMITAVSAAIRATVRAGVDYIGIFRMDGNRLDIGTIRQSVRELR